MNNFVKLGQYRHYKNKHYQVITTAYDSNTLKPVVLYRALYNDDRFGNNALWVRDKDEFCENVVINGKSVPRFTFIEPK